MRGLFSASSYANWALQSHETIIAECRKHLDDVCASSSLAKLEGMRGRDGAYFCVSQNGIAISGGLVGEAATEKCQKYDRISREKCSRMFANRVNGHTTSRESANEAEEKYAGGIAGKKFEYSFSGYLADIDEIAAAVLAFRGADLEIEAALKMLAANPHLPIFKKYFV